MPKVVFTANLKKHIDVPPSEVEAATLRDALSTVFDENPRLKSYIVDDQDRLRQHVAIFLNGEMLADRKLDRPVGAADEIYVFQALSGG